MNSFQSYPWLKKPANELLQMSPLPNNLIIEGKPGLGKTELAFDLIKLILCKENNSCGYCQNCLYLKENTHPEFLLVNLEEKKSFISVEQARRITHFMNLTVSASTSRVVLIENANRLNSQAQNALLKTLEEASPKKYFFLLSNQRGALLPTIYSRCFIQRIPSPASSVLDSWLQSQGIFDVSSKDFPSFYSPKQIKKKVEEGNAFIFNTVLQNLDNFLLGQQAVVTTQNIFKDIEITFAEKLDLLIHYINLKIGTETGFYKPHSKFKSLNHTGLSQVKAAAFIDELLEYKKTLLKIPGLNEQIGFNYFLTKLPRVFSSYDS